MGRKQERLTVAAHVSRHNSEQDDIDDKLWEELSNDILEVTKNPKYESINAMIL
jgi:hypothetical protein